MIAWVCMGSLGVGCCFLAAVTVLQLFRRRVLSNQPWPLPAAAHLPQTHTDSSTTRLNSVYCFEGLSHCVASAGDTCTALVAVYFALKAVAVFPVVVARSTSK